MYTIEKDFSTKIFYGKTIKETGRDWEINYSSILTKLIQDCGRLCENYASDLFICWHLILKEMENKTLKTSIHLFGIRENGVDNNTFILSRYNNNGCDAMYSYRKIYRLDIVVNEKGDMTMELYEVEKPYKERVVV